MLILFNYTYFCKIKVILCIERKFRLEAHFLRPKGCRISIAEGEINWAAKYSAMDVQEYYFWILLT